MLFGQGVVAVVGDGVEVEVEAGAAGEAGLERGVGPGAHQVRHGAGVDAAAVLGEGGALGEGVEAGEEGEAVIEDLGHGAGGAADAPQLEGEQGTEGAGSGEHRGARQGVLCEQGVEADCLEPGQEQEEAAEGGVEAAGGEVELPGVLTSGLF